MESFDNHHPFAPVPPTPRRRHRHAFEEALRDPRRRLAIIGGAVLLVLVIVAGAWFADPTNRARRDLAHANERIVERQRAVEDARRMLTQRIAELRAAQAEADVQVARYQGALERATRPATLDSVSATGDVAPTPPRTP
jgi:type II secretory pathway component PulM